MSLDKTLKTAANLERHRNVLTRAERILKLQDEERWADDQNPIGLPKVGHRKVVVGGKTKKVKKGAEEEKK